MSTHQFPGITHAVRQHVHIRSGNIDLLQIHIVALSIKVVFLQLNNSYYVHICSIYNHTSFCPGVNFLLTSSLWFSQAFCKVFLQFSLQPQPHPQTGWMGLRFGLFLLLSVCFLPVLLTTPPSQPNYPHVSHLCPVILASLLVSLNLLPLPSC